MTAIPLLTLREILQCVQTFPRSQRLRAVRIALNDFTPGGAVVVEFFCCAIESKDYALEVVAIEAGAV
jgi:hypothetical protein